MRIQAIADYAVPGGDFTGGQRGLHGTGDRGGDRGKSVAMSEAGKHVRRGRGKLLIQSGNQYETDSGHKYSV